MAAKLVTEWVCEGLAKIFYKKVSQDDFLCYRRMGYYRVSQIFRVHCGISEFHNEVGWHRGNSTSRLYKCYVAMERFLLYIKGVLNSINQMEGV